MDHYIGNDTTDLNYFDYDNSTTNHWFEGSIKYGVKGFSVLASTFFYGGDKDANNENQYSSYAELGYNLSVKNLTYDFFMGASLNEGVYADKFALVSLGVKASREIAITDKFTLPVSFTISTNPDKKKMYFILECTIK